MQSYLQSEMFLSNSVDMMKNLQRATTPMVLTLQKGIGLNFAQNVIMIIKNHQLKKCFWIISKRRKKLWANNILVNIYFSPKKLSGS